MAANSEKRGISICGFGPSARRFILGMAEPGTTSDQGRRAADSGRQAGGRGSLPRSAPPTIGVTSPSKEGMQGPHRHRGLVIPAREASRMDARQILTRP